MPGLFGILAKTANHDRASLTRLGQRMADAMRHRAWQRSTLWSDDTFCGGRVHLGVVEPVSPAALAGRSTRVWLDGELWPEGRSAPPPSAEELARVAGDPEALAAADGLFTAATFETSSRTLTLASDRLGLRPLYYMETADWFAFAGEVKALLAICGGLPPIDDTAVRQFFAFDHMFGDRTWWRGVQLMRAASLWRITQHERTRTTYWTFDDVAPDPLDETELGRELTARWSQAVARDSRPGLTPLLLSGGQDSRLLLAELREQGRDVLAVTFGRPQSPDMRLARECARTAGIEHRQCVLTMQNWWDGREAAIWQTDGLVSVHHLHAAIAAPAIHAGNLYSPTNFAGDLLFGGSLLYGEVPPSWRQNPEPLLARTFIDNPIVGRDEALDAALVDARTCTAGSSPICFHLSQRVRRLTLTGPGCLAADCEPVFPSVSRNLIELSLAGMTDELRLHHRFYNRWLVRRHPRFFAEIPWQATGRGLAESRRTLVLRSLRARLSRLPFLALPADRAEDWFVDYAACVRASGVRERLLASDLLIDDAALHGAARRALAAQGEDAAGVSTVLALLTAETYLRQVADLPLPLPDAGPRSQHDTLAAAGAHAEAR